MPNTEHDLHWLENAAPLMSDAYWRSRGTHAARRLPLHPIDPARIAAPPKPIWRVGLWLEHVHRQALLQSDVELIATNVPLRQDGRTLGELDVLYRHEGQVVHRELAVKYYLASEPGRGTGSWIGPRRQDRLDLKLDRLATHQLALPQRARELDAWPDALPFPDRSEVLMLGALFSPSYDVRLPDDAHVDAPHGRWYPATEFAQRFGDEPWCVLERPWWLSPEHARAFATRPARDIAEGLQSPAFVARVDDGVERAFVVPDDWSSDD